MKFFSLETEIISTNDSPVLHLSAPAKDTSFPLHFVRYAPYNSFKNGYGLGVQSVYVNFHPASDCPAKKKGYALEKYYK